MSEEELDDLVNLIETKILKATKIKIIKGTFLSFDMAGGKNNIFFKVMSDRGVQDVPIGNAIHKILKSKKVKHVYADGRKFLVDITILAKVFGLTKNEEKALKEL